MCSMSVELGAIQQQLISNDQILDISVINDMQQLWPNEI